MDCKYNYDVLEIVSKLQIEYNAKSQRYVKFRHLFIKNKSLFFKTNSGFSLLSIPYNFQLFQLFSERTITDFLLLSLSSVFIS